MPTVAPEAVERPLALAIDLGTSSVRALAVDALGRIVDGTIAQSTYPLVTDAEGRAEAEPGLLFDRLVACVDEALARLDRFATSIVAVGTTSFWHSLLGVAPDGVPATPVYMWADTRSASDAAAMRRRLEEDSVLARTGCRFHSSYWPAKLAWLERTQPATVQRVRIWAGLADWALARLCDGGRLETSVSMASGTGLLDVRRLVWDEPLLAALGVEAERLPRLVGQRPGSLLTTRWAARWPALARVPWFPALGDGACANVGAGATSSARIALTVGTSGAMRLVLPAPPGSAWHAPARLWAYRLDRELAVIGGAVSNGGNLLAWLWSLLNIDPDGPVMAAAAALAPDGHGLTILPFVAGERSPSWLDAAEGTITGLTLATRPEHLLRAAIEAASYRLAAVYADLRSLAASDHDIVANGGAILQSPLWLQIMADVLGRPLIALPPDDEATARGAAVAAFAAAGVIPDLAALPDPAADGDCYRPDPARTAAYAKAMERQSKLEHRLFARESTWQSDPVSAPP